MYSHLLLLHHLKLPISTLQFLYNYLQNLSSSFLISAGVPQGSLLSPYIIFSLLQRDIPKPTTPYTHLTQYEDDTPYWAAAYSTTLANALQSYLASFQK